MASVIYLIEVNVGSVLNISTTVFQELYKIREANKIGCEITMNLNEVLIIKQIRQYNPYPLEIGRIANNS